MSEKSTSAITLSLPSGWSRQAGQSAQLRRAVTEVFDRLRLPVYRYALSITGQSSEAEDIAQEAFLRLFAEVRKGTEIKNVTAWVFHAAHNLALDQLRRTGRTETCPPEAMETFLRLAGRGGAEDAEETAVRSEQRAAVHRALDRLSPQERRCLDLRAEGLRYREIAETLGIGISTVETFLARAVEKIVKEVRA